ncbi:GATA transcription factor 18-like [Lycium ferocissimum]|uniref:GATA transcription factor 18-like n=1 Tax=Lycium ferocissimum TaxID=112874 RepID=UPI002816947D|nr:GATA transcription factor 18-like [Lycium ferocissimum]
MNSCTSAYCHGGPCTCGLYYGQSNGTSAYSMFYNQYQNNENYPENMYSVSPPSSSSVDCTLSLGTPSTRLSTNENEKRVERRPSSYMSKCWNILQNKNHTTSSSVHKSGRSSSNNGSANSGGTDTFVARRCANCDTTSTPLWRNGPRGPKSLCNACGIRFKKEERRASAAAATANGGGMDTQHMINGGSWVHHSQSQKMPCYSSAYGNEFRFIEDDDDRHDSDNTAISFWPFLASQHC